VARARGLEAVAFLLPLLSFCYIQEIEESQNSQLADWQSFMQLPIVKIRSQLPHTPSLNIPLWSVDPAPAVGLP
jgi:hypothetical protein